MISPTPKSVRTQRTAEISPKGGAPEPDSPEIEKIQSEESVAANQAVAGYARDFDCAQHLVAGVCQSDSIYGTARAHPSTAPERRKVGARLCAKHQPQHVEKLYGIRCIPTGLGLRSCCGWSRPADTAALRGSFTLCCLRSLL